MGVRSAGSDRNLVKLRVMAASEKVDEVAGVLCEFLEGQGFIVLEWSRAFENLPPEDDKSRVYLTARKELFK